MFSWSYICITSILFLFNGYESKQLMLSRSSYYSHWELHTIENSPLRHLKCLCGQSYKSMKAENLGPKYASPT